MELQEKKLASRQIYKGSIVTLEVDQVLLPNGRQAKREVVRHGGGVCVLAVDQEEQVLLVRQYRYPYAEVLLELPAGKLEKGEDPALCGRRELEEETGYVAGRFEHLGNVYPTPGYVDEVLYLYLARDLRQTAQRLDQDEFLTLEKWPLSRVVDACLQGEILDAKSIIAVLKYNEWRRRDESNEMATNGEA